MTGTWAALAVVGSALVLLALTRRALRYEAGWVRRVVAGADAETDPRPESAHGESAAEAAEVPPAVRAWCPEPPFTAFVYHHTCSSCRALWAEVVRRPEFDDIHFVHDLRTQVLLRGSGVYREPAIGLPTEVMDELPSGLALRVGPGWRIGERQLVESVAELAAVHAAAVAR